MAYILQPTDGVNAGCDPQPFWTELDSSLYPNVYRAKISLAFNGPIYQANGNTAYLIADAEQTDVYTKEFRWDASSVIREYFARQQRNAGDLPMAFQSSLIGLGLTDLADSYALVQCQADYFEIDNQNHEVPSGSSVDISNTQSYINASTQFDEVTSLNAFDPNTVTYARFLTNCPQRQLIRNDEAAFLSFIISKGCADPGVTEVLYKGYDAAGNQIWSRGLFVTGAPYSICQVPTGLRQLKTMQAEGDFDISSGTFTDDVAAYSVQAGCYVEGDGFTRYTEIYVYEVADYCGVRIHFKNTFGVVDSVTFTGINQINNSPVSRFFSRIIDNTVPQTPQQYGRAKYGSTDYDIYRLSIDNLNEAQREWLRELQVSPLVCTEIGGFSGKTGGDFEFLPVVVDDVDGLVYDRTLSVYPMELTMRVARDKFRSVI